MCNKCSISGVRISMATSQGESCKTRTHFYQRHWQLMQAKRSLHTDQPIADIAIAYGFYDQSHLNRAFKQTFGVTPGQYRQGNFVQDHDS